MEQSVESEISVLGTIINNNNNLIKAMEILKPDDFYRTSNRIIYKTMIKLYKSNIPFDEIVLINNLKKEIKKGIVSTTYIATMGSYYEKNSFESHLNIIKNASINNQINKLCRDILTSDDEPKEKKKLIEDKLLSLNTNEEDNSVITMNEAIERTLSSIEKSITSKDGITGITTGIVNLDKAINGLERGAMNVFGARPSMGKTAFSLKLLEGIKGKVLYIQLDMTIQGMIQRLLASNSNLENRRVGSGRLDDTELSNLILAANKLESKDNIFFYTPKKPTMTNIILKAKELKIKQGLDVIIVDHFGKIIPETTGTSYEKYTVISNKLKRMALDLDVGLVLLCQLNRAVEGRENKHPTLADLRDTGAIEQDADNIGMLYREGYYKAREENKQVDKDILELRFLKVRNGMLGVDYFDYDLRTQQLEERC